MNRMIEKGAIRFRNHIDIDNGNTIKLNVHCAGNNIHIEGNESSLLILNDGYLRDSKCNMKGENNHITIGNRSILTGNCNIRIIGNDNKIEFGENGTFTDCSFYIVGNGNNIKIENDVSAVLASFHMEGNSNLIEIGKETSLHGRANGIVEFSLEEATSISVKNDCMIANDVSFRSSDSHSILNEKGERINLAGNIVIGDHVWIGMRSVILKNTIIHNNSIIGAGSICNKDYEKENCLIAGNPAKIVKEKVNWSRDRL